MKPRTFLPIPLLSIFFYLGCGGPGTSGTSGAGAGSSSVGPGPSGPGPGPSGPGPSAVASTGAGPDCEDGSSFCGGACCKSNTTCVLDSNGNELCAKNCTDSAACPSSAPCCAMLENGNGGVCFADGVASCLCKSSSECASGACAPAINKQLNPVGPYICKPNDGQLYDGCNGAGVTCDGGFCCMGDAIGNLFCAAPCTSDAECGGAHCNPYDNSHTICLTTLACGP